MYIYIYTGGNSRLEHLAPTEFHRSLRPFCSDSGSHLYAGILHLFAESSGKYGGSHAIMFLSPKIVAWKV